MLKGASEGGTPLNDFEKIAHLVPQIFSKTKRAEGDLHVRYDSTIIFDSYNWLSCMGKSFSYYRACLESI